LQDFLVYDKIKIFSEVKQYYRFNHRKNYWASQDVGKVLHPLLEGQVHGGIAQGIGWAIFEICLPRRR
jgi:hypothetical protein